MLILEGIEKAERNVLPVLNNLLENREMQLDDGRFLMSAKRYDQLLEVCTSVLFCRLFLVVILSRLLSVSPVPALIKCYCTVRM